MGILNDQQVEELHDILSSVHNGDGAKAGELLGFNKEELETKLNQADGNKAKAEALLAYKPIAEYMESCQYQTPSAIAAEIQKDPYKALAHVATVYLNPPQDPLKVQLQNEAIDVLQEHHTEAAQTLNLKSGDKMALCEDEECTCADGGLTFSMFKLTPESKSEAALKLLTKDVERMDLKIKEHFSSLDGGLGIYAQTHEIVNTDP